MLLYFIFFFYILAVCLGSNLLPRFSSLADDIKCFSSMCQYITPFRIPWMVCHAPVPFAKKQLHIMMLPPLLPLLGVISATSFSLNTAGWIIASVFYFCFVSCSKRSLICLNAFRHTSMCFFFSRGILGRDDCSAVHCLLFIVCVKSPRTVTAFFVMTPRVLCWGTGSVFN